MNNNMLDNDRLIIDVNAKNFDQLSNLKITGLLFLAKQSPFYTCYKHVNYNQLWNKFLSLTHPKYK